MVVSNRDKISKDVAKDAGKENISNATLSSEAKELGRPPSVGERYGRPRGTESLLCKGTADEPPPEKEKVPPDGSRTEKSCTEACNIHTHTHASTAHCTNLYRKESFLRVYEGVYVVLTPFIWKIRVFSGLQFYAPLCS